MIETGFIQTYTGKKFYPLNPAPETICIEDIAHALSNICRFTGHCNEFYSVAQHSILVSKFCINPMLGLLHDASEAYICDIASPIKQDYSFTKYRSIEKNLQNIIYKKFDIPETRVYLDTPSLKTVDIRMLKTEYLQFMNQYDDIDWQMDTILPYNIKIIPMQPKEAKEEFLKTFYKYREGIYD